MHGGRGVCQWCARSSPVETRQNPRPRTTTTTTIIIPNIATVNSNSNNKNNDIYNVGGERILPDDDDDEDDDNGSGVVGSNYSNPVTGNGDKNKNISNIGSRRGVTCARRRRRYCCRAVLSTATLSHRVGASRRSSHDAAAGHG